MMRVLLFPSLILLCGIILLGGCAPQANLVRTDVDHPGQLNDYEVIRLAGEFTANRKWFRVGFELEPFDWVTIRMGGEWFRKRNGHPLGPDGNALHVSVNDRSRSLGKYSIHLRTGIYGIPRPVGYETTFQALAKGYIYLGGHGGMQDSDKVDRQYPTYSGGFTYDITVERNRIPRFSTDRPTVLLSDGKGNNGYLQIPMILVDPATYGR